MVQHNVAPRSNLHHCSAPPQGRVTKERTHDKNPPASSATVRFTGYLKQTSETRPAWVPSRRERRKMTQSASPGRWQAEGCRGYPDLDRYAPKQPGPSAGVRQRTSSEAHAQRSVCAGWRIWGGAMHRRAQLSLLPISTACNLRIRPLISTASCGKVPSVQPGPYILFVATHV